MYFANSSTLPLIETAAELDAELAAFVGGVAGIANAIGRSIVTADSEAPILADRSAPRDVAAIHAVIAEAELECAARHIRAAIESRS